jgi:cell division septation protein DedD
MDDDRRRVREYYQVNLDTGRIFWIAFFIGLVLIGILVLGIYVGGGKMTKGLPSLERPSESAGPDASGETRTKNGIPLLSLFENNLAAETKYIDAKDAEKKALAPETQSLDTAGLFERTPEEDLEVSKAVEQAEKTKAAVREGAAQEARETREETGRPRTRAPQTRAAQEKRNVEEGDYFIQVGAFLKEENARDIAQRLNKRLYKVTVEEATVGDRRLFRVRVGPFETKGVALNTMSAMKRRLDLKDPFIVKRDS